MRSDALFTLLLLILPGVTSRKFRGPIKCTNMRFHDSLWGGFPLGFRSAYPNLQSVCEINSAMYATYECYCDLDQKFHCRYRDLAGHQTHIRPLCDEHCGCVSKEEMDERDTERFNKKLAQRIATQEKIRRGRERCHRACFGVGRGACGSIRTSSPECRDTFCQLAKVADAAYSAVGKCTSFSSINLNTFGKRDGIEDGGELACACNSTYVSSSCCFSESGLVWEGAGLKLGIVSSDGL